MVHRSVRGVLGWQLPRAGAGVRPGSRRGNAAGASEADCGAHASAAALEAASRRAARIWAAAARSHAGGRMSRGRLQAQQIADYGCLPNR